MRKRWAMVARQSPFSPVSPGLKLMLAAASSSGDADAIKQTVFDQTRSRVFGLAETCAWPSAVSALGCTVKSTPRNISSPQPSGKAEDSLRRRSKRAMEYYEIASLLGSGSFAQVYLARDTRRPQSRVALKLVDVELCRRKTAEGNAGGDGESSDATALLRREADVHASVSAARHPNIVRLLESFRYVDNAGAEVVALAMEHCPLGDMQRYMKRVRDARRGGGSPVILEDEGTFLRGGDIHAGMSQMLAGLSFLHSRGVCHRDIKSSNVFLCHKDGHAGNRDSGFFALSDCQIKLGDFGLAIQLGDDENWAEAAESFCGTPSCIAPEVCTKNRQQRRFDMRCAEPSVLVGDNKSGYGQPADLWSLGCLLYTMIAGRNPFAIPTNRNQSSRTHDVQSDLFERSRRIQQIIEKVTSGDWELPGDVTVSGPLDALLHQLLDEQPSRRGTARGLLNAHPFFQRRHTGSRLCDKENAGNLHEDNLTPFEKNRLEKGTLKFSVFFLGARGVVVHRETTEDEGLWMQVTGDGATVLSGKLERPGSSQVSGDIEADAFSRSPADITSRSFLSMKAFGRDDVLSAYRSLVEAVHIVQAHTPKISLSILSKSRKSFDQNTSTPHTANKTGCEAGLVMTAKAMLMQNGPLADLEIAFVDGKIIRFSASNGSICVRSNDSPPDKFDIDPTRLYDELRKEPDQSSLVTILGQKWPSLSNCIVVFIYACRECIQIEAEASQDVMYPILKTVTLPM
ncbi:hypothetical protein THAOC_09409 [Thalassiosira oceanica]|uniref:Protein kinase domain-containing protein n=1 Tax=Thalassiosira oceanica TaxID=159749 RepID=K0SV87_THAOC|nr:hypothetical protein THAOC_09409 [Thalassiosira oceanica]|eukprot:EJK69345.1 hypothetical protein THAOC_09409 [Thalassiosira oceanica]